MKVEYTPNMTNWMRLGFPEHAFVSPYNATETSSESTDIISYEPDQYSNGYDSASSEADEANSEGKE